MSDVYDIDGVTIAPQPGGYYLLTHPTLENPDRIRGKDAADARAREIALAAGTASAEGHIPGQNLAAAELQAVDPALVEGDKPSAEKVPEDVPATTFVPPAPTAPATDPTADLLAIVKRQQDQIAQLLAREPTTVVVEEGEAPVAATLRAVPRQFTGHLDNETKQALKKLGVSYTRIVLEEHSDIPPTGLFVGHNGRSYMISPGVEVDVPDFLIGVLNDAKMSAPVVDEKSRKVLGYRERMKYNFRKV